MGLLLAVEETGEVVSVPWSLKYFLIRSGAVQNCHSRLSCATPLINAMQCGRRRGAWSPGRESTLGVINFYISLFSSPGIRFLSKNTSSECVDIQNTVRISYYTFSLIVVRVFSEMSNISGDSCSQSK